MYWTPFFVIVVVAIILFFTAFSCAPPLPYTSATFFPTLGTSDFSREGFSEYTTYPDHASKDAVIDIASTSGNVGEGECSQIQGFDGLYCNPSSANAGPNAGPNTGPNSPSNPTDIFSQSSSSINCKSYGYTNSKGFLCMDDHQVKLLTSRGGNASGGDMQIGPAPKLV